MKNYLFEPFKDEEDKIDTWNSCKSGIDQGIMIFMGRLESSYDVIISDLKAENVVAIADERVIKELQADNKKLIDNNIKLEDHVNKYGAIQYDELKAENDRLNADNKRLYQEHKECSNNG